MMIPAAWTKAKGACRTRDDRQLEVSVWGYGRDDAEARREAASRLKRLLERVRRGDRFPDAYGYGSRALREEILETYGGTSEGDALAVLTRNRYGAVVLNTAQMLFLDVDFKAPTLIERFRGWLQSKGNPEQVALEQLRTALTWQGGITFRLYRTAAGFRAIAIDQGFEPDGDRSRRLFDETGTDPAFARLCRVQKSFRARLTPKPWRCGCDNPPGQYPRSEPTRAAFNGWLEQYEDLSCAFASARYLETVGTRRARPDFQELIDLHDARARALDTLPLA